MLKQTKSFDIIVVGAGPGGSYAAKTAKEYGFSVLWLEKQLIGKNGRYKACGGAIAWELVEEIGYPEDKMERVVESLELHHVDGENFSKKGKGAVVWRSTFDKYLNSLAIEAGAELNEGEGLLAIEKENNMFKVTTKSSIYKGKYVIAADGVTSTTLKLLEWPYFRREDVILTITKEMRTTVEDINRSLGKDTVHLFFGIKDLIKVGYAWLFPKSDSITVGWGNQIDLIKNSRKEFQRFLEIPYVRGVLKNCHEEVFKPHLIPVGLRPELYKNNAFAVGDAGGLVDPISGKGIPYAMMSGKFAIDAIKRCENKSIPDKLGQSYERFLERQFLKVLKAKRVLRDTIFKNDENLKKFLSLWESHRSSEIVMRKLI